MADKLRVLLAIGEMSGGGSQRQLIGILRRLDRTRFEPQLYLVSAGGELLPEVPPDVPVHIFTQRCPRRRWLFPGQAFPYRIRDMATLLRDQKIDLVYDRTYDMTLIAAGATYLRPTQRISAIVTDPKLDLATNSERFRLIKRLLLRRAYHSADRVVAVSNGVRDAAIAEYGLSRETTLTVPNFFEIERLDRLLAEPLPVGEARLNDGRFEIVTAGRLHPQKGFMFLLQAIDELVNRRGRRQIHLRILGTGLQHAALASYIARNTLGSHVTLAGFRANPLPYFRQADLFCLSSLYEGMPNALVEAMLCHVPVLATNCPSGPAEILEGGRYGRLVAPANALALAQGIEDAIDHRESWQRLVPAARQHIEADYSPIAGIQRLQQLMLTLAGAKIDAGLL